MNKYRNKKVYYNGKKFDSEKERNYYMKLRLLEKSGKITDLKTQVSFILVPRYKKNEKTVRAMTYVADFTYYENGVFHVVDTKGYRTEVYKLKKKLFEYIYEYTIEEI